MNNVAFPAGGLPRSGPGFEGFGWGPCLARAA